MEVCWARQGGSDRVCRCGCERRSTANNAQHAKRLTAIVLVADMQPHTPALHTTIPQPKNVHKPSNTYY